MTTSPEAFTATTFPSRTATTRQQAKKRSLLATLAAARHSRIARWLLDYSPQQEALLRENRERAWSQVSAMMAGR